MNVSVVSLIQFLIVLVCNDWISDMIQLHVVKIVFLHSTFPCKKYSSRVKFQHLGHRLFL